MQPLTNPQIELLKELSDRQMRIYTKFSLQNDLQNLYLISKTNKLISTKHKQDKPNRSSILSLINKKALILVKEELKYNSYYVRLYDINEELVNELLEQSLKENNDLLVRQSNDREFMKKMNV